jgi:hypothetical protein
MTQDKVIVMSKHAWHEAGEGWVAKEWFDDRAKAFEAFAKLVAAKEREACAKVCDELQDVPATEPHHCAEDIRARGEQA